MIDNKIAFFGVKSWERPIIEREIINLDVFGVGIFEEELQDNLELAKQYDIVSIFIYSKADKEVLDKLPNLKMIATRSTGVDHIDIDECKKRKVVVANVPVYGSNTVAEYAFALILAVAKKVVEAHQAVEEDEFSPEGLTGIDLFGKTLGIVGLGKIGANVAKMARGFGMKVVAVEKNPDLKIVKKYKVKLVDLETLLKESDVVTLHVPASKETYHLINRSNIKLLKEGSILVNTSRGAVVESESMIWALNKGILRGVGLDVVEEEDKVESMSLVMSQRPTKEDLQNVLSYHMLRDREDVVFTPHNAFNTEEAIERIIKTTIENIKEFCKKN
ncbi:MAG: D-isomer specific 2-hydroxyacid dehydrogenase NAD-binding protein [Candidatus Shapirobacteria bacterium GW2011_GWE1_38_10]|uniref:D-isomer specific 2-hydroxyacid dehydrogenase NAD-binding protein n=1 Tax=Candidatus Shapirobacteria bacterium GW2011_GWE1_38_10 TaxID=1618488 RepID=A0A0G0I698_9BACT|nr:MAG: D-isomer specific 2-hydroxyacid dehydrogenase NAD-binding protein [Candidatus Shapirobacteria bacterium GW2011_GWF2_37_20]KKQ50853.1 MAG: D-isomer specific 2-hydroxyacid dehydrogenase NAD-binding protein [Candidatus Shapirobacteria bacterium GW2011_GWE1_38_10]KKQ63620.1 MAG: D-isomer specific 2-hydroxyacid dehydrogenase NAD-binding protein [Candidatus Shapirobacteria bacterium GW2011_GWF1_38_23]